MIERKALEELDFYKLLHFIEEFSNSEATKRVIKEIYPYEELQQAKNALKEFSDFKRYLDESGILPLSPFPDISDLIEKSKKEGVFFDSQELSRFLKIFQLLDKLSPLINKFLDFPALSRKIREILGANLSVGQPYLLERLEQSIDHEGNILDSASPMLKYLRKQIKATEERIKQKLEELINRPDVQVFLQDRFITKRNNRWVIPVRMDSKGQIAGQLQDVSRSGETAFIEPLEISHMSKKLEELVIEERLEEIRILKELSKEIHNISDTLQKEFELLVYIDKLFAVYKFSQKFKAEIPEINDAGTLKLFNARHPVLMTAIPEVVPLDIDMGNKKLLLITGPNAGGKTVTIKTVGLLTAMAVSGIPVPASSSSQIPFVKSIYVDLYHEGSLEEQLSTFAFHIVKLKEIIENADSYSLVLIDEIGTNTDPEEGSALACAILEELKNRHALTLATTHLSKVKIFVASQDEMQIASMLFDEETMTPLYKLKIGSLAPSYALEIAQKYGFPERLIKRAQELKGTADIEIYNYIREIEKIRTEYQEKLKELEAQRVILLNEMERLNKETMLLEEKKHKIIESARAEAQAFLNKIKKEINLLYEEAKTLEKKKIKEASRKLAEFTQQIFPQKTAVYQDITVGDSVKIDRLNLVGKVIEIENNKAKIQTETATVEVNTHEVEKIQEKKPSTVKNIYSVTYPEEEPVKKLDIRGLRVDEALPLVERFLNELSLSEVSSAVIVHGIGKGILKEAVRQYLREHPLVESISKGSTEQGGDAVTLIKIK